MPPASLPAVPEDPYTRAREGGCVDRRTRDELVAEWAQVVLAAAEWTVREYGPCLRKLASA